MKDHRIQDKSIWLNPCTWLFVVIALFLVYSGGPVNGKRSPGNGYTEWDGRSNSTICN